MLISFFAEGIEHFCQPNGWTLRQEREEPKFFIAVLTDINGSRHYCAVLSFSEAVAKEALEEHRKQAADEEMEEDRGGTGGASDGLVSLKALQRGRSTSLPRHVVPGVSLPTLAHDTLMFAPKCLVLVSRHDLPDVLKNCLRVIYTAYSECLVGLGGERIRLESLIGNLLGSVRVPPAGSGRHARFSLGAGDRMSVGARSSPLVPCTHESVATLFRQLGIRNVLTLFCACMTELKILFYSQSFNRLTEACTALASLMYPMRYSHVFIPILPSSLLEVLATPTPFVIGVNAVHEHEVADLLDVIKVDLDGGAITIPENMTVATLPPQLLAKVNAELCMVLHPELSTADDAFVGTQNEGDDSEVSSAKFMDKELRAVMLRLMVQLLAGYRSCLTIVRIHPKPYITFHKAAFLGLRNFCDFVFIRRMLDCMFFNTFVCERGSPWRPCDIFDEAYSLCVEQNALETADPKRVLTHIRMWAKQLYINENPSSSSPNNQTNAQKIPLPAQGATFRIHQPVFPHLDEEMVAETIAQGLEKIDQE